VCVCVRVCMRIRMYGPPQLHVLSPNTKTVAKLLGLHVAVSSFKLQVNFRPQNHPQAANTALPLRSDTSAGSAGGKHWK
jgi:hypothetical protein